MFSNFLPDHRFRGAHHIITYVSSLCFFISCVILLLTYSTMFRCLTSAFCKVSCRLLCIYCENDPLTYAKEDVLGDISQNPYVISVERYSISSTCSLRYSPSSSSNSSTTFFYTFPSFLTPLCLSHPHTTISHLSLHQDTWVS